MARRIREFDWSATPIGPIESWPQSLRTATSLCLASRFQLIIFWTRDLIQLYNDAFLTIVGNKHPRALGQSARECWAEMWEGIAPLYEHVFQTGTATWTEHIHLPVHRYGYLEESFYTMSYTPIFLEDGSVGGVFNVVIETTQQVVAERRTQTLRDLAARTAESQTVEEACKAAVDVLGTSADIPFAMVYLLDPDGATLRLAGAARAEPGGPVAPREIPVPAAGDWPAGAAIQSRQVQMVNDVQARFGPIPGGPWGHPVQTALVLPLVQPGRALPYGVLVAGATPQRALDADFRAFFDLVAGQVTTAVGNTRAYEEERKRAEALAEIDRAKTAFFSNVSHEFRTPLTLMLGPVEDLLLRSHTDLSPAAKGQLEVVNRNGLRLLRLVNTLLDFSRIEAGRVQAVFEPTDLAAFTTELASVFRAATERAGLSLTVDCPKLPEPVYVDRDMWEKIVLNLISNAFKFTFEGEIEVKLRTDSSSAVLTVRDTGVGIPAEEMPRLFERFHRVQNMRSRTHEGSGIGLALVQELVKLHGGSIRAESRLGVGTTFIITVPLGHQHLPSDRLGGSRTLASTAVGAAPFVEEALRWLPQGAEVEEATLPASHHELMPIPCPGSEANEVAGRPRILIADDNADMRHYLARLLNERYNVQTVPDGQAALTAARERRPDLVLSDVMMPNLGGFGLVRELRADIALKTIPILLLSARAGEESRVEGLQQGADDYLIKPFSARELLARVAAHLEMARMRQEAAAQIRRSEERFETVVDNSPVGICVWRGPDLVYELANPAYQAFAPGKQFLGRTYAEVWPEAIEPYLSIIRKVMETGEPYHATDVPVRIRRRSDGPPEDGFFNIFYSALPPDASGRPGVLNIAVETTGRKQAESRLRDDLAALTQMHALSTRVLETGGLEPLLQEIMDVAVALVGAERGTLQLIEGDSLRIVAQHGHQLPFLEFFASAEARASVCGEALKRGQRVLVEDVEHSPLFADTESLTVLRDAGVRAVQSTPLLTRQGELLGILTTQWAVPHVPDEHDLWRIDLLVRQAADLIEHKQAEESLREAHERAAWLARFPEENPNPVLRVSAEGTVLYRNPAAAELPGWTCKVGGLLGEPFLSLVGRAMAEGREVRQDVELSETAYLVWAVPLPSEHYANIYGRDITDRKRAEEALRQTRDYLDNLFNYANAPIIVWDPQFQITRFNAAFEHLTGRQAKDVLGQEIDLLFPPESREESLAHIRRTTSEKRRWEVIEIPILHRNGSVRTVLWNSANVLASDHKTVLATIAQGQDITERKQAEEALRDSERLYRAIGESIDYGVWTCAPDGRNTYASESFLKMVGLTQEQCSDFGWGNVLHPDDAERTIAAWKECVRTGGTWDIEHRFRGVDGQWHHVLARGVPVKNEHGETVCWAGINLDISRLKQAEEALRETRDYLDNLFNYANAPIIVWNPEFKITRFNPAFERLTGHKAKDVLGREIDVLFPPESREESLAHIRRTTSERQRWEVIEIGILHKNGSVRTVLWNSANVLAPDNQTVMATIAQGQDITERKRAEESLREANEQLQGQTEELQTQAEELQTQAEELRANEEVLRDLNATLESKVAQRTAQLQQRARQLQKLTLEASQAEDRERKRMAEILHDDLQQIIAGAKFHLELLRNRVKHDASLQALAVQIDQLLKDAIEKSRGLSHELSPAVLHHGDITETLGWLAKQIQAKQGLVVHVHTDGPIILQSDALKGFLYKAAQELLFNVVKHARVKEARIRVRRYGPCVCLSVSDRGRGFDPQGLREAAGFGLLSIRERIELLGGRMKIKSAPGRGSTFFIVVPEGQEAEDRGQKTEDGRPKAEDGLPSSVVRPPSSVLRVLLADDHRIVREGLRSLLREEPDVEIVGEAAHGREAVDWALRLKPDVVIMDVSMPLIDGDEATRQIKTHLPQTRIIALSTYNEPETIEKMYQAGAEGYVLKTASADELLAAIRGSRARGI